jgi:uncharacterized repeat protein (TIGR01451 family)
MRRITTTVLSMTVVVLIATCAAGASSALAAAPGWHVTSRLIPSRLAPGGEGTLVVQAINLGNAPMSGATTFTDGLPAGLTLESSKYNVPDPPFLQPPPPAPPGAFTDLGPSGEFAALEYCKATASSISCSQSALLGGEPEFLPPLLPYNYLELRLKVKAEPGAASEGLNEVHLSGGGARAITAKRHIPINTEPVKFGVGREDFSLAPEEEGGEPDTHAGSHPYQLTNVLTFNRSSEETFKPPALPRNLHFKLPAGQIGNATALEQCSDQEFAHIGEAGEANECQGNTAIGVAVVVVSTTTGEEEVFTIPVFNLTPANGEPARFGFEVLRNPVILDTALRDGPGEDYGVTVNVSNITQLVGFQSATVTFWGAPADPSHNEARGWGCLLGGAKAVGRPCVPSVDTHPAAFLTMPTNCSAPFIPSVSGESWPKRPSPEAESRALTFPDVPYHLQDEAGTPLSLTGCNQLVFGPSFEVEPTTRSASAPSGLDVNLNFADEGLTNAAGTAQSQIKDTTVTLPEGFTINPSSGVGLGGCSPADYARETLESLPGAGCPNNSKLGTVSIHSPLIKQTVQGSLFVAQPYENPFGEPENGHPGGTLVALYIVAKNPENGVLIKLAGKVTPDPVTGRLTTTFANNPQLPFDHFNFHFREGQQAPLITPATCGTYTADALLAPWSDPTAPLTDTSSFQITKGFDGGACPSGGAPPFTPQIAAGTQSNTAGSFSPFSLHLTRTDGESEISTFSTVLPSGLSGVLAGIPFCPEVAIALTRTHTGHQEQTEPACPASSRLGSSQVGTGVGAVLAYTPGTVYLGGPYNGDPFSLVSVTSAVVGPFDLGSIVIRFGLKIDPHTAQVSVDPTASEPIPTIIDGIVTHVRDIRVSIDRPNFTLNPTSCSPMAISSTLQSNLGQSATVSSPFQAASCASLKFAPDFKVSTSGKTSRANGASLHVKLAYPKAPFGSQANIKSVKVNLPKQLPSRLTTLQKACPDSTFNANPAACPSASRIGTANATTPLLPVGLTGPVYFVSHGGAKFPELVIVLSGYGVTVQLQAETFISKAGITSSTFRTVPDVPVGTFELTLPEGKYSALAANGNLCRSKLKMPTAFTAQNGAVIHQSTPIGVTSCPKAKKKAKKK